jgi:hypothetical protein
VGSNVYYGSTSSQLHALIEALKSEDHSEVLACDYQDYGSRKYFPRRGAVFVKVCFVNVRRHHTSILFAYNHPGGYI